MSQAEIAGILVVLLALVMFVIEIKSPGFGLAGIIGIGALTAGLILLFGISAVTLPYIILSIVILAAFVLTMAYLARKAQKIRVATGEAGMVGLEGRAETALLPEGKVMVRGELWEAWSPVRIEKGEPVRVVGVRGLRLEVTAAHPDRIPGRPLSSLHGETEEPRLLQGKGEE